MPTLSKRASVLLGTLGRLTATVFTADILRL